MNLDRLSEVAPVLIISRVADPLRIIADTPTSQPGLGFREYVEALADAIRGGSPPQFTIGLYGSWGTGKSSLLSALAELLSQPDYDVLPVLFDAWRYERSDFIVVPLLHAVHQRALELGHHDLAKTLRRALESIIFSFSFSLSGLKIDPRAARQMWDESGLTPLDNAFSRPLAEFRKVPEVLHGKRIAILIDDLDRCSPDHVVELLEAINLIMDIPGFIFVLALDYEVVVSAVQERYPHVSGHAYIQKIVQLPFRVPPLEVNEGDFPALVPEWKAWVSHLPVTFASYSADIAVMGLRGNPRQIKRFLNSFLFVQRIVQSRGLKVDYELLAALIGLQLAWPDAYRTLQEALVLGENDPSAFLKDETGETQDQWLIRYVSRFVEEKKGATDQLKTLMQLTAVVVGTEPEVEIRPPRLPGPADEIREANRNTLMEALTELGYSQSKRSERLWYSNRYPGLRFAFQKHYINLEKLEGDRWLLERAYLLTREVDDAINRARAPARDKP